MKAGQIYFHADKPDEGIRLSSYLRRKGVSLSTIRGLKYVPGGLMVNGKEAYTNCLLQPGDQILLQLPVETGFSARPERIHLDILYHSVETMVINKPAGMVMHPSPSHKSGTLANAVCGMLEAGGSRGGVFRPIGRLDGNTSGLVLCAANAASAAILTQTMKKSYLALVSGRLPLGEGCIDAPLAEKPGSAVAQQVAPDGRPSCTSYRVLSATEHGSLVQVTPQTGRTHQIRTHFSYLGYPLIGDSLYGGSQNLLKRHALHCAMLDFTELCGNHLRLNAPLPDDMQLALSLMGLSLPAQGSVEIPYE